MRCQICSEPLDADMQYCPSCGGLLRVSSAGKETTFLPTLPVPPQRDTQVSLNVPQPPVVVPVPEPVYVPFAVQSSSTALVSLIFGVLGWTILPVVGAIVAVIAGHLARRDIHLQQGRIGGEGLAVAGLVLGYLQLIPLALGACFVLVFVLGLFGLIF